MRAKAGMRQWLGRHRRAIQRIGIALAVLAYVALWYVTSATFTATVDGATRSVTTDLDAFFIPAARLALTGHPWQAYTVRYEVIYPNANGPLSLAPLTALLALAQHFGWLENAELRRGLILAGFAPFLLLLAYEVVRAVDRMRGARLLGWRRLALYVGLTLSPTNWIALLYYGHIEQPLALWLAFLGTRLLVERRPARAGVVFGLALLTRSELVLFPLVLVLILLRRRQVAAVLILGATALVTLALGLLPFWLADRADLVYSLVTFRGELPVGAGNVWGVLLFPGVLSFAQRWDSALTIGAACALVGLALVWRRDLRLGSPILYDLLAVACLCFPLLIKTLWPYYFFEPWIFVMLWWFAWRPRTTSGRVAWIAGGVVPLAVMVGAQVSDQWRGIFYAPGTASLAWNAAVTWALLVEVVALLIAVCLRPEVVPTGVAAAVPVVPTMPDRPNWPQAPGTVVLPVAPLPVAPTVEG